MHSRQRSITTVGRKLIPRGSMLLLILGCFMGYPGKAAQADPSFAPLQANLAAEGFDPAYLASLYGDPAAVYDPKSVSLFFVHSEAKLNYDQFTSRKSIARARKYMTTHQEALQAAQQRYQVDQEIITAILLVETKLGTYLGRSYIFRTLSTMAALADPQAKARFWEEIPTQRRLAREAYDKKVRQKSQWAYQELKALLRYAQREKLNVTTIRGSYAGAMGISQFMPSNALRLAQDGNQDGKIDLFDHTDAIMSVAGYLSHHGWYRGIPPEKAYKVILRYNYSRYYAKTIQKVARKLKG
ncbi:MAG: lytic murein transglycosylase [Desulfobacterales bacterium]